MAIIIKSAADIADTRRAGAVVAFILRILSSEIKVEMTTRQLDKIAMRELERYGARPHGIGRAVHEEPQIPDFGPPGLGPVLRYDPSN